MCLCEEFSDEAIQIICWFTSTPWRRYYFDIFVDNLIAYILQVDKIMQMNLFCKRSLFIILFLVFGSIYNLSFAQTDIYDTEISVDTTWTKSAGPYIIHEYLFVNPGVTLTIEAGTIVKFDYSLYLSIFGKVITNGTSAEKVYFTSRDDDVGGDSYGDGDSVEPYYSDWNGIEILGGGSIDFSSTEILYLRDGLTFAEGSGSINSSHLAHSKYGLDVYESSVQINGLVLEDTLDDAVNSYTNSTITANNFHIKDISGRGICMWTNSNMIFNNSSIENLLYDMTVSVILGSRLDIKNSTIINIGSGFELFANSTINFEDSILDGVLDGGWAVLPFYNNSTVNIIRSKMKNLNAGSVILAYNGSNLNISDSNISNISSNSAVEIYGSSWDSYVTTTLNIASSTISDGDGNGLVIYGGKMSANITNTTIKGFLGDGIQTFSYPFIKIDSSEISGNNIGIESWGTNLEIKNSIIKDNLSYGISNNPTPFPLIVASSNWWGDASGPYNFTSNASGTANQISDNVTFSPWLITLPGAKPECCSNIVFIPGLQASRLYSKGTFFENQLWEPNRNADIEKLFLNANGESINTGIYTNDIIKRTNVGMGAFDQNIYKKFSDTLDSLVSQKKINGWEALPYDWRFDLNKIVTEDVKMADEKTLNFINEIIKNASSSETGKVTLVTHSNGGLVVKVLINELKAQGKEGLIDKVIMVAAPQLGTPSAIVGMLHGDGQEVGLGFYASQATARTLGENMMGAYNLLPEDAYFSEVTDPVIKFDASVDKVNYPDKIPASFRTKYGNSINSITKLQDYLLGKDGRTEPSNSDTATPNVLKSGLLSQAKANHTIIDSWTPPENIKIIQLAGWGVKTVSGVEYFGYDTCALGIEPCVSVVGLDRRPIVTEDGDNTVVSPSATAMNGAEKYYLNMKELNKYFKDFNLVHSNIFEATSTIQFITNSVLKENTDISSYITTNKPTTTSKTLELSLHSPVSINIYDTDGNHTGIVDNPNPNSDLQIVEENIPGSKYMNFGEGKYVLLDEGEQYSIKLQGLDFGTFTLETNISQNGVDLSTSTFLDIPTSPNMIGEVVISTSSSSTSPIVKIDANGDGVNDFNVSVSGDFDPILYLQILKKTVETLSASKKTKDAIIKKIDSIIKSLEKNKTKVAIQKIKIFSKELTKQSIKKQNSEEKKHEKEKNWKNVKQKISSSDAEILLAMLNKLLDNINK